MKKLLSICVPTYNRAYFVERLIKNFLKVFKPYYDIVELCISDNCSTDNTAKILKNYSKKYSFIKCAYNKKNVGFDKNLILVTKLASADYCWLMGDDDLILERSLSKLMIILEKRIYDYVSAEFVSSDNGTYINWDTDVAIVDKNIIRKFFIENFGGYSFMGSNIFRRDILPEWYHSVGRYDIGFIHTLIPFMCFGSINNMYIFKESLVFDKNDGSYPTKKSQLLIHIKASETMHILLKNKFITFKEYKKLMSLWYTGFHMYVLFYFFAISEDGCSKSELNNLLARINAYLKYNKKTRILSQISLFIIKHKVLLSIFKYGYVYVYVHFFNIFRKNKQNIAWTFWDKNKLRGGRKMSEKLNFDKS